MQISSPFDRVVCTPHNNGGVLSFHVFVFNVCFLPNMDLRGWSGVAKVSCIWHHWGAQLILAYSWARPAILVEGRCFYFSVSSLSFLFLFLPSPSLLSLLLSLFSLSLGDDTKWPTKVEVSSNPNSISQSKNMDLKRLHRPFITGHTNRRNTGILPKYPRRI